MNLLAAFSEVERVAPNAFLALSVIQVPLKSNSALRAMRSTS